MKKKKTITHLLVFILGCLCLNSYAQQADIAKDTLMVISDTGYIPDKAAHYLQNYCDTSRHGYDGPMIISVDKFYQPVDSVFVINAANTYGITAEQIRKMKPKLSTNQYGYCRIPDLPHDSYNLVGVKDNLVFEVRETTYEGDHVKELYFLRPKYDHEKKGVRINLHNSGPVK